MTPPRAGSAVLPPLAAAASVVCCSAELQAAVRSAQGGAPLSGAACSLLRPAGGWAFAVEGYNVSGADGVCAFNPAPGAGLAGENRVALAAAAGHYAATAPLQVAGNTTPPAVVSAQSRLATSPSELRVVLRWDNRVPDMDLWARAPWGCTAGPPAYGGHGNRSCTNAGEGSVSYSGDVVDFYGPETVTISGLRSGVTAVYVHIYEDGLCWTNVSATVEVWSGAAGGLATTLRSEDAVGCDPAPASPSDCPRYWHVIDYDAATGLVSRRHTVRRALLIDRLQLPSEADDDDADGCPCTDGAPLGEAESFARGQLTDWAAEADKAITDLGELMCADQVGAQFRDVPHADLHNATAEIAAEVEGLIAATVARSSQLVAAMRDELRARLSAGSSSGPQPPSCCTVHTDGCAECAYDSVWQAAIDRSRMCYARPLDTPAGSTAVELRAAQAAFTNQWRGYVSDPRNSHIFAGFRSGAMAIAPLTAAALGQAGCGDYDPRLRSWWVDTVVGSANVAIVMDGSEGVTGGSFEALRQAALGVLRGLSSLSTASVTVVGGSGALRNPGWDPADSTFQGCAGAQQLQASVGTVRLLSRFVREAQPLSGAGAVDAAAGLRRAGELLATSPPGRNATNIVLMLLASPPDQNATVLQSALPAGAHVMVYALDSTAAGGTSGAGALSSVATVISVTPEEVVRTAPLYTLRPELQRSAPDPVTSAPYADFATGHMVVTVAAPVFVGGQLRAVAAADILLVSLVGPAVWHLPREHVDSYAFIVDGQGGTVLHPLLPRPDEVTDDDVRATHITALEPYADFRAQVLPGLLNGSTGSARVSARRLRARGDPRFATPDAEQGNWTYAWKPVQGSSFVLVVAQPEGAVSTRLNDGSPGLEACAAYHTLRLKGQCSGYLTGPADGSDPVLADKSSVMLSPMAFEDPFLWLRANVTAELVAGLEAQIEQGRPDPNLTASGGITPSVTAANRVAQRALEDARLSAVAERCWLDRPFDHAAWRFVATATGVYRRLPGRESSRGFDPRRADWYLSAAGAADGAGGYRFIAARPVDAGKEAVVTVARAFTHGPGAGAPLAGVLGVQLSLAHFNERLAEALPGCGGRLVTCVLLDASGGILWDSATPCGGALGRWPLTARYPGLAGRLAAAGLLEPRSCGDAASGFLRTAYKVPRRSASGPMPGGCGWFAATPLDNVDATLVVATGDTCVAAAGECAPCTCALLGALAGQPEGEWPVLCQPCQCGVTYDRCLLQYNLTLQHGGPAVEPCPSATQHADDWRCEVLSRESGLPCAASRAAASGAAALAAALLLAAAP